MTYQQVPRQSVWRHVPNAISIARICAAPVLIGTLVLHRAELFRWLLLVCLISDILDGLIARGFHLTSPLGATLDSVADIFMVLLGLAGIVIFQRSFVSIHYLPLVLIAIFYAAEVAASLLRYRRVSSFHTLLSRIAAYLAGIFFMSLFFWGYHAGLFYAALGFFALALAEEMILICLLPKWRSDVGGVYQLCRSESWKSARSGFEAK